MKILKTMIAWNPGGDIEVGAWPDKTKWSRPYRFTTGACYRAWHDMKKDILTLQLFLEFHAITVRDSVDIAKAHKAFLVIDEYRDHIAPDIQGASPSSMF